MIANLNAEPAEIERQVKGRLLFVEGGLLEGVPHDADFYTAELLADVQRALVDLPIDAPSIPAPRGWMSSRLGRATSAAVGITWTKDGKYKVTLTGDEFTSLKAAMAAARRSSDVVRRRQDDEAAKDMLEQRLAALVAEEDQAAAAVAAEALPASEESPVPEASPVMETSPMDAEPAVATGLPGPAMPVPAFARVPEATGPITAPTGRSAVQIALDLNDDISQKLEAGGVPRLTLLATNDSEPAPLFLANLNRTVPEEKRLYDLGKGLWREAEAETIDLGSWRQWYALRALNKKAGDFKRELLRYTYRDQNLSSPQLALVAQHMEFTSTLRVELTIFWSLLLVPRPIAILVESQPGFWTSRKEEAFRYYYNKARNKADFLFVDAQLDEKRYFQRPNDPRFIRDRMDDSDDESS